MTAGAADFVAAPGWQWRAALALCAALLVPGAAAADASWETRSERGVVATLEPRSGKLEIGAFQEWVLSLRSTDDVPVDQARIMIGGGMPEHGHGLPTSPAVTDFLGDGRYLIEGLKFSMAGRWIVAFAVDTPSGSDRLAFVLDIDSWSENEREVLASLRLGADTRPPPSPSNRVADDPDAAHIGEMLFFDEGLSANDALSCATCHEPDRYFTDGRKRGVGINRTGRNTPTVIGAGFLNWFYWDGRRDSLWSQALVPFEAADEMGGSRVDVVRTVGRDAEYRSRYEAVFGAFPDEMLQAQLPEHAGPLGESEMRDAWHRLDRDTAQAINTVYANLGKAVAAYQRTLPIPVSRFDHYVDATLAGDSNARALLTADELAGLELYLDAEKTHCLRCHNGPWLTNGGFHNIGTGVFNGPELDFGRVFGVRSVVMDEFNCLGSYSDAAPGECSQLRFLNRNSHVPLEGAFKVPSLRNLAASAPYMHDGRFADLPAVIEFYRRPLDQEEAASHELPPLDLSDMEARQLIAFLLTLSAEED